MSWSFRELQADLNLHLFKFKHSSRMVISFQIRVKSLYHQGV